MARGPSKNPEVTKRKKSEAMKRYFKEHPGAGMYHTRKMREANFGNQYALGAVRSPETRRKISLGNMGNHHNNKSKTRSDTVRKLWQNKEFREKMAESHRAYWQTEASEKQLRAMILGMHRKPNKPETAVLELLDVYYPGQWEYTGDGSFILNKLCPDFVQTNGKKEIIEVFGDYWHREGAKVFNQTEQGRIAAFAKYGYRTLVIWEGELVDIDAVAAKIKKFVGGGSNR